MKKLSSKVLILFISLFLTVNSAFAWDEIGHKLTAYIAWERLTPDVREKVIDILLDAPEDSDLNVHYDRFNSRSEAIKRRELFMYASTWSDVVRNRNFDVRYKSYHQSDWHYGDIFWKQENGKATILTNFPEESGKAIYKLADFEKILRDSSYKTEEKAIALAWFLHVGGDIHNPLHNASRVTDLEPKGDRGGNSFVLQKRTENNFGVNLHSYWDGIVRRIKPRKNDACDADYLSPIARKIMKKYPYSKLQNRLKLGEYKAWSMEGFNLLNKVVYRDITRNQMPSKKYRKQTYKIATEQIALAGYRLGEMLNQIFSQTAVNSEETKKELPKTRSINNKKNAVDIWKKVRAVIVSENTFKFLRVEINDATVILKGIIGNSELKQKAVQAIKNIEGVEKVIDSIKVDASLLPKNKTIAKKEEKSSSCKIIRKVLYPVSKRRTPEQRMRIALLDICPPNKGMVARPMTSMMIDGETIMYEYDVIKVFDSEDEAKKYARSSGIKDISF